MGGCECVYVCVGVGVGVCVLVGGCLSSHSLYLYRRFVNLEPSTLYRTILYIYCLYLSAYVSVSFFFLYTYIEGSNHQLCFSL